MIESVSNVERNARICARREQGLSFEAIGVEFELSREQVRRIVRGAERKTQRSERLSPLRKAFASRS